LKEEVNMTGKKLYPSDNNKIENTEMLKTISDRWGMAKNRALNIILKYIVRNLEKGNLLLKLLFDKEGKKDG
jgi:hypothetical protein